jgi:hypothetical protein
MLELAPSKEVGFGGSCELGFAGGRICIHATILIAAELPTASGRKVE